MKYINKYYHVLTLINMYFNEKHIPYYFLFCNSFLIG